MPMMEPDGSSSEPRVAEVEGSGVGVTVGAGVGVGPGTGVLEGEGVALEVVGVVGTVVDAGAETLDKTVVVLLEVAVVLVEDAEVATLDRAVEEVLEVALALGDDALEGAVALGVRTGVRVPSVALLSTEDVELPLSDGVAELLLTLGELLLALVEFTLAVELAVAGADAVDTTGVETTLEALALSVTVGLAISLLADRTVVNGAVGVGQSTISARNERPMPTHTFLSMRKPLLPQSGVTRCTRVSSGAAEKLKLADAGTVQLRFVHSPSCSTALSIGWPAHASSAKQLTRQQWSCTCATDCRNNSSNTAIAA